MYRIREIRKQKGDTIKALAKKVQYDYSNLSKIERGLLKPTIKLLSSIADEYDVHISYFLNNESINEKKVYIEVSENLIESKYHFMLDGKRITSEEAELVILIIRKFRGFYNKE
jgi:transcriptional regulator with XRE-family HTH domain